MLCTSVPMSHTCTGQMVVARRYQEWFFFLLVALSFQNCVTEGDVEVLSVASAWRPMQGLPPDSPSVPAAKINQRFEEGERQNDLRRRGADIFAPSGRETCSHLIAMAELVGRGRKRPMVKAFSQIIDGIGVIARGRAVMPDGETAAKTIGKALDNLDSIWSQASIDLLKLKRFSECALDEKERTIFMKLVELQIVRALEHTAVKRLVGGRHDIVDTDGNTVLHLAVLTSEAHVVKLVLNLLQPSATRELLLRVNKAGQTPHSIAKSFALSRPDVVNMLQGFFTALNFQHVVKANV